MCTTGTAWTTRKSWCSEVTRVPGDLQPLSLGEVLDDIGSARPSSGAGVAAGVALALGIACAQKAVSVTLKHRDDDRLADAVTRLQALRERALEQARLDAVLFESYLRHQAPEDAARLVTTAEAFQQLSQEVAKELQGLDGRIDDCVDGDITAARALLQAARAIEAEILRENRRERAKAIA